MMQVALKALQKSGKAPMKKMSFQTTLRLTATPLLIQPFARSDFAKHSF